MVALMEALNVLDPECDPRVMYSTKPKDCAVHLELFLGRAVVSTIRGRWYWTRFLEAHPAFEELEPYPSQQLENGFGAAMVSDLFVPVLSALTRELLQIESCLRAFYPGDRLEPIAARIDTNISTLGLIVTAGPLPASETQRQLAARRSLELIAMRAQVRA